MLEMEQEKAAKPKKEKEVKKKKERELKPLATLGDYLKAHPDFYKNFGKLHLNNKKRYVKNKEHK